MTYELGWGKCTWRGGLGFGIVFVQGLITNLFPNHNIELSDLPEVIEAKTVLY